MPLPEITGTSRAEDDVIITDQAVISLIVTLAGIAGSSRVEDDVIIAGQVGISDHVTIGRGARVLVQGGVIGDIPPGGTYWGTPARPHREVLRAQAALYRLGARPTAPDTPTEPGHGDSR